MADGEGIHKNNMKKDTNWLRCQHVLRKSGCAPDKVVLYTIHPSHRISTFWTASLYSIQTYRSGQLASVNILKEFKNGVRYGPLFSGPGVFLWHMSQKDTVFLLIALKCGVYIVERIDAVAKHMNPRCGSTS